MLAACNNKYNKKQEKLFHTNSIRMWKTMNIRLFTEDAESSEGGVIDCAE